jgi:hypothetical protein
MNITSLTRADKHEWIIITLSVTGSSLPYKWFFKKCNFVCIQAEPIQQADMIVFEMNDTMDETERNSNANQPL